MLKLRPKTISTCSARTFWWRPCTRRARPTASSTCPKAPGWSGGAQWRTEKRAAPSPWARPSCMTVRRPSRSQPPFQRSRCSSKRAPSFQCSPPMSSPSPNTATTPRSSTLPIGISCFTSSHSRGRNRGHLLRRRHLDQHRSRRHLDPHGRKQQGTNHPPRGVHEHPH